MPQDLKNRLVAQAREAGFDAVRVTTPDILANTGADERFAAFLDAGFHGSMSWMEDKRDRRADPRTLWPEVRSIVMLAMNYGPEDDPLALLERSGRGGISVYARGDDYHDVVKKWLKRVARWLNAETGEPVKVFVDTAPVMEKPLAAAAGIGWQGKHTNLVSREYGSWLFLGSIFSAVQIPPDGAHADRCGDCRRCLDICPTDAFPSPYRLDARRCISYLTIEHKGHVPAGFRQAMGNRIYGCDDCLAVCPWNKFAKRGHEQKLSAREELKAPALADLLVLDDAAFRALFARSPVKRTGRDRFLRNVLIAAGNSGDAGLLPLIEALLADPSPLVRAMAVWATGRLAESARVVHLKEKLLPGETDPQVASEWDAAVQPGASS